MSAPLDRAAVAGLSVLADPALQADLSSPALAMAKALDAGLGAALGVGKSLSEAGTDAVANLAGDLAGTIGATAADIVGDVASAVPIVGAVVKAATAFIGALTAPFSEANKVQACQSIVHALAPQPTGSQLTGSLTPADLFAPIFRMNGCDGSQYVLPPNVPSMEASIGAQLVCACFGGPTRARSMPALVLMQLTEGTVVDVNDDWDWRFLNKRLSDQPLWKSRIKDTAAARQAWERAVRRDVRIASAQWRARAPMIFDDVAEEWAKFGILTRPQPHEQRGLPTAWRTRFRNLRRGIEAAYGPNLPHGTRSDGGLGLWIVYMDLLATAFARGYLSPEFATFLLARQGPSGSPASAGLLSAESYAQWLLGTVSDADRIRDPEGSV